MRLAGKLVGTLVLGIAILLALDAAFEARHETDLLEADMRGDAFLYGRPLADLVGEVWATAGEARARELLARADVASGEMHLALVALAPDSDPSGTGRGLLGIRPSEGEWGPGLVVDPQGGSEVVTMLPVEAGGRPVAALRLAESRRQLDARRHSAVARAVVLLAVTGIMSSLLVVWLGVVWIGRPLGVLAAKVRRIGDGDLTGPVQLRGRDELAELGLGLNDMCDHLATARETIQREQAARLTALEQLRQADRLRTVGRLASEVAHELGTPLNVVSGRAALIASGELAGDDVIESARIIKAQSQKMSASIRQLLDFSRLRQPERRVCDLAEVAEEAFRLLGPLAQSQDLTLDRTPPAEPALAKVADGPLQQVLANLIVNALHACEPGGHVLLETGVARDLAQPSTLGGAADWAYLRVRDDGAGIAEADMPHLFEPFFTTKDIGAGTGLGLSLARGIVQEHNGWIGVESAVGDGSAFTIYLPHVTV